MVPFFLYWLTQGLNFFVYSRMQSIASFLVFYALSSTLWGIVWGRNSEKKLKVSVVYFAFFTLVYCTWLFALSGGHLAMFDNFAVLVFWSLFWLFVLTIIYLGEQHFINKLSKNSPFLLALLCVLINLPVKYLALQALPFEQKIAYLILPVTTAAIYRQSAKMQAFFRALVEILFAFSLATTQFKSPLIPLLSIIILSAIFLLARKEDYELINN